MKKSINYIIILCCVTLFIACSKDFIVKDIKNETVAIIAPADNLKTPNNAITFWWEELDGAEKYNLQIVKPDFNSVQQLLVDTNVIGNKFNYTFTPGTYQWRIKATNAGGSTSYTTRTLVIDTTSNLNLVSVSLIAPGSMAVTANNNITFTWNTLAAVDYYELKLTNTVTSSVTTISNIIGTSYAYSFTTASGTQENYSWQVKAYNSFSQTQNDPVRFFRIDRKAPFLASIVSPNTYSLTIRDTTYLTWNRNITSTDIAYDIISISSDSTFASVLGTQNVATSSPIRINTIYSYSNTPTQVWWRVSSVDSVGNISSPNQSKRLYLY